MFKLTIKKSDGSTYWIEHFNSINDLNKWLNLEKTRAYWGIDFSTIIEDLTQLKSDLQICLEKRAAEYPPLQDYLDAIINDDKDALKVYIDTCKAIKIKYPKPDGSTK